MKRDTFEQRLLQLWMSTRMPLSRVNVQFVLGVPRQKLERWLDELVKEGVLELESDEHGEMLWMFPGAARPSTGLTKPDEVKRMGDLKHEVGRSVALVKRSASSLVPASGPNEKSLVVSGLLSLFLGPIGWLYAAPLKQAGIAAGAFLLFCAIMPHILLVPLLGAINAASAAISVAYAWRYNQNGQRTPLLPEEGT